MYDNEMKKMTAESHNVCGFKLDMCVCLYVCLYTTEMKKMTAESDNVCECVSAVMCVCVRVYACSQSVSHN